MDQAKNSQAQAFVKFLATRKILIADPSASARSGMFRIFQDFGAKTNQIILVNSFPQAAEEIQKSKPNIVIAEYDLGKRCGLDLLQNQRSQFPKETKDILFILVTGNTSQTAVARAAEEDIDAYILKPLTPETVRNTIMKAAITKLQPTDYLLAIEEGKKLMAAQDYDNAERSFEKATQLDKSPSLAFYYIGQVKFIKKIIAEAKGNYDEGLGINKIHYKCLVGMYELLANEKEYVEAYEIVKRISQYFPANPKRLSEVLRLAIMNAKYEDVEKYYSIFCNIDERDEILIKYICAALVVCGRHYLTSGSRSRALELFQKAGATGTGRVKILKEIAQALIDFEMTKEARSFLAKFPPESQATADDLLMRFQIINVEGNAAAIIAEGRDLLSKGMHDARFYEIMVQRSIESKLSRAAEELIYDAVAKYPKLKDDFTAMLKHVEKTTLGPATPRKGRAKGL